VAKLARAARKRCALARAKSSRSLLMWIGGGPRAPRIGRRPCREEILPDPAAPVRPWDHHARRREVRARRALA
jgi:hypothetical protein